ncbi:MAG: YedE-related selenium metabolism membrane protein, partial [Acetivibrio sp.]
MKEKRNILIVGAIIGVISVALVYFGNPANMGFCLACFVRDTAG